MPYVHELETRRRIKRAALGLLAATLLLLIALVPVPTMGWAGLGPGSAVPTEEPPPVDTIVGAAGKSAARVPPAADYLTFPAYTEWSDLTAPVCEDCDWTFTYGAGANLDAVDDAALNDDNSSSGREGSWIGSLFRHSPDNSRASSQGDGFATAASGAMASGSAGGVGETTADTPETTFNESTAGTADIAGDSAESAVATRVSTASAGATVGTAADSSFVSRAGNSPTAGTPSEGSSADGPAPSLLLAAFESDAPGGDTGITFATAAHGSGPGHRALSDDLVQALLDADVGTETVYGQGEPQVISDLVDLKGRAQAENGGGSQQVDGVPEPTSLALLGLALSAGVLRLRRAAPRRP